MYCMLYALRWYVGMMLVIADPLELDSCWGGVKVFSFGGVITVSLLFLDD